MKQKYFYPEYVLISFHLWDSKSTTTYIQPTNIYLNDASLEFTYADDKVSLYVPIKYKFNLTFEATDYVTLTYTDLSWYTADESQLFSLFKKTDVFSSVLKWDHSVVSDLDTHVVVREINGTTKLDEIIYNRKNITVDSTTISLDVDDTGSGSGETLTFDSLDPNHIYYVIIGDWTHHSNSVAPTALRRCSAYCLIYSPDTQLLTRLNVSEASGEDAGRYWEVFSLTGSGVITILNRITDTNTYNMAWSYSAPLAST